MMLQGSGVVSTTSPKNVLTCASRLPDLQQFCAPGKQVRIGDLVQLQVVADPLSALAVIVDIDITLVGSEVTRDIENSRDLSRNCWWACRAFHRLRMFASDTEATAEAWIGLMSGI